MKFFLSSQGEQEEFGHIEIAGIGDADAEAGGCHTTTKVSDVQDPMVTLTIINFKLLIIN